MKTLIQSVLAVSLAVFLVGFFQVNRLNAAIFEGSEVEGVEAGYCLQFPDDPTCDCANDPNDIRCYSEAQFGTGLAKEELQPTGITHTDNAGDLIIKYVNFVLPYLTLAAFVGIVVAGFMYVTAFGNDEQMGKAKKILIWSIVGLLLVIASYAIVQFVTVGLLGQL
jgi:hypothetical protein